VSNLTAISFYPRGGGNRYLRYIKGDDFSLPNMSYDQFIKDQILEHRYLLSSPPKTNNDFVLTHCANVKRINEVLAPTNIIFIKTDFKNSLQREWMLHGKFRYSSTRIKKTYDKLLLETYNDIRAMHWPIIDTIDEFYCLNENIKNEVITQIKNLTINETLNSAWATICWHHQYYERYTADCRVDVNVDNDNNEFANMMREELARYPSELFDFCWKIYTQYRPNAKITDLYENDKK
jgi:hypothetical protein